MEPTPEQLERLYDVAFRLTRLQALISLVDMLPDRSLTMVVLPRQQQDQRIFVYINPNGEARYETPGF